MLRLSGTGFEGESFSEVSSVKEFPCFSRGKVRRLSFRQMAGVSLPSALVKGSKLCFGGLHPATDTWELFFRMSLSG